MQDNLNSKYKSIVDFLQMSSEIYFNETGIKVKIEIVNDFSFNARVSKIEEKVYKIEIRHGCLCLENLIENITNRYTEDDLKSFWRFRKLNIFEKNAGDTYREELNQLFGSIILLHIFFHECGHITAKYIDKENGTYAEMQPSDNGGYEKQEQEMVADWLSTKFLYKSMFFATIGTDKIDFEELLSILEQLTILYWLSLTIEFQIFDSVHTGDVPDYSLLTHPHLAVRLYYSLDAMQECILDIFNIYGFDDMQAEYGVEYIVNNIYILIESYLQITETPISIKKDDPQIMDCYITLRDVPYCSKVKDNYFHLIELPKEYRKSSEKYKRFFKNKNI